MTKKILSFLGALLFAAQTALAVQTNLSSAYVSTGNSQQQLTDLTTSDTYTGISPDVTAVRFVLLTLAGNLSGTQTATITMVTKKDGSVIDTLTVTVNPGNFTIQLPAYVTGLTVAAHSYTAFITPSAHAALTFSTSTYLLVATPSVDVIAPSGGIAVGGSLTGGIDTYVLFDDANTIGEDAGLTYNKTTDVLTAVGGFVGALTGNVTGDVTGNVSGSSGSTTGNAATATALAADPSDCAANTYATTIAASGNLTCGTVTLASADFANQGTTTTVLHGNAAGNPSFGAVTLTTDVTGTLPVGNGGTGLATVAADQVALGTALDTFTATSIGDCDDTAGNHLNYDTATHAFSCGTSSSGGGGSPGGADTHIQYNNGGAFGGEAKFTYDDTTVVGRVAATGGTSGSGGGESGALFDMAGTLHATPAASAVGVYQNYTSAGTAAQSQIAVVQNLAAGYTGSSLTTATSTVNQAAGTGTTLQLGGTTTPTANVGLRAIASPVTAGTNIAVNGWGGNSTTLNIGTYAQATSTAAGTNVGLLGAAGSSTEATGPKNIAVLGTLSSTDPSTYSSQNGSFAGYFDAGTLPDSNSKGFYLTGTFPSVPTATTQGAHINFTGAGSTAQTTYALNSDYNAGYTGASTTVAVRGVNASAGTGDTPAVGSSSSPVGNFGGNFAATAATTGLTLGVLGTGGSSTGTNMGVYGRSVTSAAGTNYGVVGTAFGSTEATDYKNIAGLFTLNSTLPSGVNKSRALYVDGGTLGDGDRVADFFGTLPSTPTSAPTGINVSITGAGSTAQAQRAVVAALQSGYTGSSYTAVLDLFGNTVGTGSTMNLNTATVPVGNYGLKSLVNVASTGLNIGTHGEAQASTGSNIGGYFRADGTNAGTNVGVFGNAANSTEATNYKNIAGYFSLSTSDPAAIASNTSVALAADGNGSDIFRGVNAGTTKMYIGPNGSIYVGNFGIASLPSCSSSTKGLRATATDANAACSFGSAPTAGGTTVCPVYCDGSAWVSG